MYVVLIGPPGAGKGTQAALVAPGLGLAHLASGDMFREAIAGGTGIGRKVKQYLERGELVPDEITVAMVVERLERRDGAAGFLLDGFPRNLAQAQALDRELRVQGVAVDAAVYLAVPEEELLRRLSGRWLCALCQAPYHEVSYPPRVAGRCDQCGSELYQRPDDTVETARHRLEVYFEQTMPLIDYYRERGVLDEVDGFRDVESVRQAIVEAVQRRGRI